MKAADLYIMCDSGHVEVSGGEMLKKMPRTDRIRCLMGEKKPPQDHSAPPLFAGCNQEFQGHTSICSYKMKYVFLNVVPGTILKECKHFLPD